MKHTHTEGPGPILKSRFARGIFPLVAALLAFALAAPSACGEVLVYEGFHATEYQKDGGGLYGNVTLRPTQIVSAADFSVFSVLVSGDDFAASSASYCLSVP